MQAVVWEGAKKVHMGAKRLFAVDLIEHRLRAAAVHCGAETLNAERVSPVEALAALTNGRGPVHVR